MDISPRDMLIEMHTDIKWLKAGFESHLKEHFQLRILAYGALLSSLSAIVLALIF